MDDYEREQNFDLSNVANISFKLSRYSSNGRSTHRKKIATIFEFANQFDPKQNFFCRNVFLYLNIFQVKYTEKLLEKINGFKIRTFVTK